jgi:hypothetical protein
MNQWFSRTETMTEFQNAGNGPSQSFVGLTAAGQVCTIGLELVQLVHLPRADGDAAADLAASRCSRPGSEMLGGKA